mmetsp:Transcript_6672/g.19029  ORF Transcript_6672/g.19029 Transcript_6672/m.19029 type:complete len:235 (+) Transcript_6672:2900-3604(+)
MERASKGYCRVAAHEFFQNANQPTQVQSCQERGGHLPSCVQGIPNSPIPCGYQNPKVQENAHPQKELSQAQVCCLVSPVQGTCHHCLQGSQGFEGRAEGYRKAQGEQRKTQERNAKSQGHARSPGQGRCFELQTREGTGGEATCSGQARETCRTVGAYACIGEGEGRKARGGLENAEGEGCSRSGQSRLDAPWSPIAAWFAHAQAQVSASPTSRFRRRASVYVAAKPPFELRQS